MTQHRTAFLVFSIGLVGASPGLAQVSSTPSAQSTARAPVAGPERDLLRSLQLNPATAPYGFATERRGAKVALRGRVGTKQAHDAAIQTAIALGVPVIDDVVIDTLAAHQAASYPARMTPGMGYGPGYGYGYGNGSAGPSSGLGGYPGATSLYGSLPYTYPQPLFGRLDEPFYGFEPPAIGYPPWWGAMTAQRLGPPAAANGLPQPQIQQQAGEPVDNGQAANLPAGTIDMAIDPRGVATLRGDVPSLAERITLGQRVAQTPGVTSVVNLLNVKPGMVVAASNDNPPPPPVPADLQGITSRPAPLHLEGVPIAVEPDSVGARASKAVANRAGLAKDAVKVKVRDGVASITGKVPTVYEAMIAYRAVQRTPGVREIEDRLEFVVPDGSNGNPLADRGRPEDVEPYLEAQIRRQVGDLAHVDRVRVQGDSLDLKGTLEREEDRPRFDAIIRSMPILRGFRISADLPSEPR